MVPTPPLPDQSKHPLEERDRRFDDEEAHDEEFDEDDEDEWGGDGEGPDAIDPDDPDGGEPDPDEGNDDDLVTIATFRTAPEAELARTALEGEGIESFIADAETVTMDWLLGVALGDVKVQVARRNAAQARAFLAETRKNRTEEETSGPAACLSCGAPFPDEATQCLACGWSFEAESKEGGGL